MPWFHVVSSVACFSSGQRAIYNSQLATLDVQSQTLCRSIFGPPPEVSQSGLDAATLYIRCMLIGSKNLKTYWSVASKVHSFVLPPPNEPSLGNDSTSPICSPSIILDVRVAFAPRVANAKLFVSSGEWGVDNMRCHFPIRTTTHSRPALNLRDANKMCCSFIPSVQNFMPCECPVNVRRKAHNGSAAFSKMNVQGL